MQETFDSRVHKRPVFTFHQSSPVPSIISSFITHVSHHLVHSARSHSQICRYKVSSFLHSSFKANHQLPSCTDHYFAERIKNYSPNFQYRQLSGET